MNIIIVVILTQLLFTGSDLLGRHYMIQSGFASKSFFSLWFLSYFLIRNLAMFGQLYVFSKIELGHTMALFGASSIILANILGFFFLREALSPTVYIGVVLAIIAFLILAIRI